MSAETFDFLTELLDRQLGPTPPLVVDQQRIADFAACTLDKQWIHVDVDRAAAGPFGGTIAHGYLTLSLLVTLVERLALFPSGFTVINYGIDKLRFPAPLPSGSEIALSARVTNITPKGDGRALATLACEVNSPAAKAPVLVADVLYLFVADQTDS